MEIDEAAANDLIFDNNYLTSFAIDYYEDGLVDHSTIPTHTFSSIDCPLLLPDTATVWIDANQPVSNVVDSDTDWYRDSSIQIEATASDTVSGVKDVSLHYRYSLDSITWPSSWEQHDILDTDATDGWSWDFNWPGDLEGNYQFYTIATDYAGNVEVENGRDSAFQPANKYSDKIFITEKSCILE